MSSSSLLKKSSGVSIAIVVCRILGLLREILLAKIFGGGMLMTAWGLAFMLPNLFRRLFGEGAVGSSIIPIISYSIEKEDQNSAKKKLGAIFLSLSILLSSLCVVFSIVAILIAPFIETERVRLALELIPLVIPYAIFICLIGAFSSVLNCVGRFFLPALGTLSLNITMVLCLLFICPLFSEKMSMLKALAISVVFSGIIQFAFTAILLKKADIFPDLRISQFWKDPSVGELWKLALPGIIGASALQISFVIDRSMACWLGDYAVPALNYSDRIIDLPVGVFAVAMTIVVAPSLAKSAARDEHEKHQLQFLSSLSSMLFLSIPSAVFIFICKTPLIRMFFMRGEFGQRELDETVWAMTFYSFGIPFFCCVKIMASSFHSRKDMKTPVKISILCIILNIVLNFLLMFKLKQGGIALATTISSLLNCVLLSIVLKRREPDLSLKKTVLDFLRFSLSSAIAATTIVLSYHYLYLHLRFPLRHLPPDLFPLSVSAILFYLIFLVFSHLFGSKLPSSVLSSILNRLKN